jgi:FkbM family methyltransferase
MAESVGQSGRVLSFEPHPGTYQCLRDNMLRFSQTSVFNSAVWDSSGRVQFVINSENTDAGAVLMNGLSHEVNSVRLDDLTPVNVSFIKVDVEGAEFRVLMGAKEIIETQHPVLFLETLAHAPLPYGNTLEEMYQWIKGYGYELRHVNDTHDVLCL